MSDRGGITLELECKLCGHRPPRTATMESQLLHFQFEHDTDTVEMNLSAVCSCGATMRFTESRPTGGGFFDHFHCDACGNDGRIKREPT